MAEPSSDSTVVTISDQPQAQPYTAESSSDGERVCRNCHEAGGDLIKPCQCSGSIEWVHRDCLNTWRSVSPNRRSFTHCDICGQPYFMRRKALGKGPYIKLGLGIARDIILVLATVVTLIAIPGGIVALAQHYGHFMETYIEDSELFGVVSNPVFDVFVWGAAIDCFIIGIAAMCYGIARCFTMPCCRSGCSTPGGRTRTSCSP